MQGWTGPPACLLLLAFARGVARVALGLLFGLKRGLSGGLFFLFAGEKGGGFGIGGGLARLLFGPGGLAGLLRLGACSGLSLALGLPALHLGIVGPWLGAKLVQDVLPGLQRGFLTVREAWFLEDS